MQRLALNVQSAVGLVRRVHYLWSWGSVWTCDYCAVPTVRADRGEILSTDVGSGDPGPTSTSSQDDFRVMLMFRSFGGKGHGLGPLFDRLDLT
jgi:hypothetical protein